VDFLFYQKQFEKNIISHPFSKRNKLSLRLKTQQSSFYDKWLLQIEK
jgi:hypothetical protein